MSSKRGEYASVAEDISSIMEQPGYDDGSIGPVLVRLGWHASGTYEKKGNKYGSNGATMRFEPEASDAANAGLEKARVFLEPIKNKYPWISYADLWTLASCVALQVMGGPTVSEVGWQPGRIDYTEDEVKKNPHLVPKPGNLPDASQGHQHVRDIFYRMGFNDQEIVALMGAHSLGRTHTDRSGYSRAWTHTPTRFSNQFFKLLVKAKWGERKWNGPTQFEGTGMNKKLMMLPTDMSMVWDSEFRKWTEIYAEDKKRFFSDFAAAYGKLISNGVPSNKKVAHSKL